MTGIDMSAGMVHEAKKNALAFGRRATFCKMNGHNGLRSIGRALGTRDYARLRVGIGRPPGRQDPADFVLSDFPARERGELGVTLEQAADAVEAVVELGFEAAQQRLHSA